MRANHILTLAMLVTAFALNAKAQTAGNSGSLVEEEDKGTRRYGPIDYGPGPGVPPDTSLPAAEALMAAEAAVPAGGPAARTDGVFGAPVTWSLIPIHTVLLPDGRVMSYGLRTAGQLNYDVWDPSQGTDGAAHMVLPNTTGTSTFCSGQSVVPTNGEVLLTGGTTVLNGIGNTGVERTTIFDPQSNSMRPAQPMVYRRWYSTIVPLGNGDKLILGGREDTDVPAPTAADWNYATTPEVFTLGGTWRVLPGARSDAAFGLIGSNWSYPRAYQMPSDPTKVFVLAHNGKMFYVNPAGDGTITQLTQTTLPSDNRLPTAMFAPGKLISVRSNRKVVVVGLNGLQPAITTTADLSQLRYFSNATVLPNGKVLVTGGSAVPNQLTGVASAVEIWDPATGQWTLGAKAAKARLYHSTALLLPDGSVLTAGGGSPGPVTNLNAEIYYPPYLYDSNGNPAARPTLLAVPDSLVLHLDKQFPATVATGDQISRVTLLHTGSVTHTINVEQRFQDLPFTQAGQNLQITSPQNPNYTVPGYYILFVFNNNGVPSVAKIIKIMR